MRLGWTWLVGLLLIAPGCSSESEDSTCKDGATRSCSGEDGCEGTQTCTDGKYGGCLCGADGGAGGGAGHASGGTGQGGGASECDSGSRSCDNDGVPQLCVDGRWEAEDECAGDTPLCNDGLCVCEENAIDCLDEVPRACVEGAWVPGTECLAETQVCQAGECVCVDDEDPDTSLVEDEELGCGQRRGDWIEFDSEVHIDLVTGLAWATGGGSLTQSEAATHCEELERGDLSDWRLATISEVRDLASGCAATQTGGECPLSDTCLDEECNSYLVCVSCRAGDGPSDDGLYVQPRVRFNVTFHTSSNCADCDEESDWVYRPVNGNFAATEVTSRIPATCVHVAPDRF